MTRSTSRSTSRSMTSLRGRVAAAVAALPLLASCAGSGGSANGALAAASGRPGAASTGAAVTPASPAASPPASSAATPAAAVPAGAGRLCGRSSASRPPATYQHVIWIWMENHSYRQVVGGPGTAAHDAAPYLNGVVKGQCGLATNYHNVTHPSLPNYLAAVSGVPGATSDCGPRACPQSARTLFAQLSSAGRGWRGYAESMPARCDLDSAGRYAARHNPAVYYPAIRTDCRRWDVPMGGASSGAFATALATGKLPAFSFVTPNLCHDTHDCPVRAGDDWLHAWLPRIAASPAWRTGRSVLFLTWDEGAGDETSRCARDTTHADCHVATFVLSRWTKPGTTSAVLFNHYSLLKTTEGLLGIRYHLGHAADRATTGMRRAFHL